jgi:hypothetical protein
VSCPRNNINIVAIKIGRWPGKVSAGMVYRRPGKEAHFRHGSGQTGFGPKETAKAATDRGYWSSAEHDWLAKAAVVTEARAKFHV